MVFISITNASALLSGALRGWFESDKGEIMSDTPERQLRTLKDFVEEYYNAALEEKAAKRRKDAAKTRILSMKRNKTIEEEILDEYRLVIYEKCTSKQFHKDKFAEEFPTLAEALEQIEKVKVDYLEDKYGLIVNVSRVK
jgi:hypothetical protein